MENIDLKLINIIINNKKELSDFFSTAGEGIFESEYRRFIKNLLLYYNSFHSPPTLNTFIEFCGNNSNLKEYVNDIWEKVSELQVDSKEYSFILDKINKRYNSVILQSIKDKIASSDNLKDVNNFIFKATNEIKNIGDKKIKSESTLSESAMDYFQKFKSKQENKELNEGTFIGFSTFDYYTNGLRDSEVLLIGGETGCGKSILMLNCGINAWLGKNKFPETKQELNNMSDKNLWQKGNDILYFSLEMPDIELKDRIISNICSIDNLNLMKGDINLEQAEKMSLALSFWKKYPYNFKIIDFPRGCTVMDIQDIYDKTCQEFKPKLVIIDYLGIIKGGETTGDENADWTNMLKLSKEIFEFARDNQVATITAVQLTTTQPGKTNVVGIHRTGRSKGIADNVNFYLQIENRENEMSLPDARIHCVKSRRSPKFVMKNLIKNFQHNKFVDQPVSVEEISTINEEDLSQSIDKIFGQEIDL